MKHEETEKENKDKGFNAPVSAKNPWLPSRTDIPEAFSAHAETFGTSIQKVRFVHVHVHTWYHIIAGVKSLLGKNI